VQKYGIIKDTKLEISNEIVKGTYPLSYAPIPDFDQEKEYVIQSKPVDKGNNIYLDVEIKPMSIDIIDINSIEKIIQE
jgi:hypothetical protein